LASRDVIGQAKGMIMERFDLNAGGAFDLLRRVSQDTNTPVADIAYKLTTSPTGRTRGGDRAQDHRWSQ
jgi:AmiR/NasT family two-component response regulator